MLRAARLTCFGPFRAGWFPAGLLGSNSARAAQSEMLLYFPAENAAVSAVVLLCSCAQPQHAQGVRTVLPAHGCLKQPRDPESGDSDIPCGSAILREKGRDKRETHYRTQAW